MAHGVIREHQVLPETDEVVHTRKARLVSRLGERDRESDEPVVAAERAQLAQQQLVGGRSVEHPVPHRERVAVELEADAEREEKRRGDECAVRRGAQAEPSSGRHGPALDTAAGAAAR